ncbi:MAG: hypothetical protein NTW86_11670 [Candidatus Sumerlaeota bacterium]|nr:hypothetical protein [Candidatus Sumerlaeota bacterium]
MSLEPPSHFPRSGVAFAVGAALFAVILATTAWDLARNDADSLLIFGPPVVLTLALFVAAWGLGALMAQVLGFSPAAASESVILSSSLGLGACGWVLSVAGQAGLFRPATALALLAIGMAAAAWRVRGALRARGAAREEGERLHAGPLKVVAILLLAAGLAMAFLAALTPPASYDVLEYHLPVAREWTRTGRIGVLPFNFYSQLPAGVETLYGWGLLLQRASDAAPKLLNFGLLVLTCLAIGALAVRLGASSSLALLAAAHFAVHPTSVRIYVDAFADMGVALWAASSALCALEAAERRSLRGFALAGALAGFALGAKTTAAGVFLVPALVFLVAAAPNPPRRRFAPGWRMAGCAAFLLAAAIAFLPWPVRDWGALGNPAAPFLNAWFGADPWRLATERFWLGMHGWSSPWTGAYSFALGRAVDRVGWLWAAGALAALAVGNGALRRLALVALGGVAAYSLLTGAPDRFASPVIALGIAATFAGVGQLFPAQSPARHWAGALLALAALAPLWQAAQNMAGCGNIDYAARALSREGYLSKMLGAPTAGMFECANGQTPADARILCLYDARAYLVERPCLTNTVFDKSPILGFLRDRRPGQSLAGRLREAGFTHLLVNEWELGRLIATHATKEVTAEPLYRQIACISDERQRFEAFALHPEWHAPYAREQAAAGELREIASLLDAAAQRALFIQRYGAMRMFVAPIP